MNRKNLTAAVLAGLAGVAGLAGAANAQVPPESWAVNLNPDGLGEVLIYPYYTTNDDNTTLVTVVNTTGDAKAVKVRFLEGYNSREVLDFNLYLSKYDVWVAALADSSAFGAEAGVPHLFTADTSCTVPYIYKDAYVEELGGGLQEFLPYAYTGSKADGGPTDIARASEGYLEIIEMGVLTDDDEVDEDELEADVGEHAARKGSAWAATHTVKEDDDGNEFVEPNNCEQLVENWTVYRNTPKPHPLAGWWAADAAADYKCDEDELPDDVTPLQAGCGQADYKYFPLSDILLTSTDDVDGGLFGGAAIINVPKGTMFSYDAKAVQGYDRTYNGVHFYPGTIHPSLNDGNMFTTSHYAVINPGGGQSGWLQYGRGVDAISAVFMHDTLANTFVIEEDIAAGTEWVMTFPTKAWYVDTTLNNTAFSYYTPDPSDTGCNGWDPGEPNPYTLPVYQGTGSNWKPNDPIPDGTNTNPPTGEDWSTCTPLKNTETSTVAPFTTTFDGKACEEVWFKPWDREESPSLTPGAIIPPIVSPAPPIDAPPGETPFELCYEVNVLRFGEVSVFGTESDLLYTVKNTPESGWARITFAGEDGEDTCVACDKDDNELHKDSEAMRGLPVIGFSAEQYTNGVLEGGVLANYGGLFSHKGSVNCASPYGGGDYDCDSQLF